MLFSKCHLEDIVTLGIADIKTNKESKEYNLVIDGEIENLESKAGMKYWWWKIQ